MPDKPGEKENSGQFSTVAGGRSHLGSLLFWEQKGWAGGQENVKDEACHVGIKFGSKRVNQDP